MWWTNPPLEKYLVRTFFGIRSNSIFLSLFLFTIRVSNTLSLRSLELLISMYIASMYLTNYSLFENHTPVDCAIIYMKTSLEPKLKMWGLTLAYPFLRFYMPKAHLKVYLAGHWMFFFFFWILVTIYLLIVVAKRFSHQLGGKTFSIKWTSNWPNFDDRF